MATKASKERNDVAKAKYREALEEFSSAKPQTDPHAKAETLARAFELMREAYQEQRAIKLLGYMRPWQREVSEGRGRDNLNNNRRDAAADRMDEVVTAYQPGDTAEEVRRKIIQTGSETYSLRSIQRDLKKIREGKK